ncbi:MFS transporter [Saccharopolyspora rectivirgula]|jgi:MFS family permease|uniref:MFS transporter n=1 Tax=Saccharopolyspora rectivirgula TaxID=28042 RepID=UPI00041D0AC8|nr:MFS transporter [Saccharopolyspora rectivirgula]
MPVGNRRTAGPLALLLLSVLATQTSLHLARPLISYRVIALGGDALAVGLITSAYALLSLVVALPLGRYTDRTGRTVAVLLGGTFLLATGAALLGVSSSLPALGASSAVLGFGHIAFMLGGQGFTASLGRDRDLDRNFGLFTAATSGGQLLGPLLVGLLLEEQPTERLTAATANALHVAALICCAAIPTALLLRRTGTSGGKTGTGGPAPGVRAMLRRPGMLPGLFSSLALLAAVDILTAYLPLIAHERGIPPALTGLLLAVRAATSLLSRLSLAWMTARWSRKALIITSSLGAGLSLAITSLPVSGPVLMAAALGLGGFLLGIGQPLTMTAVVKSVPDTARGAALAVRLWANRIGQIAMPAAAGAFAGVLGAAGALWFSCGVLVAAAGSMATTGTAPHQPEE